MRIIQLQFTMRKTFLFFALTLAMYCSAQEGTFEWNLEKESAHNGHRNDSSTWKMDLLEVDKMAATFGAKPMTYGAFPVPKYELVNNGFEGIGNGGEWTGIPIKEKQVIYHNLYVGKKKGEEMETEVFFTILVLTDTIDAESYTHTDVSSISRNHPHYTGQGFVKTKTSQVDFISFLTADENAYALVNLRLFDLRIGRIVLIAPQKDGSMRSLQLDAPVMSVEDMDQYIKNFLSEDTQTIDFFAAKGNI